MMRRIVLLAGVFLVLSLGTRHAVVAHGTDSWSSLFDGKTLDGWKADNNADSFTVRDGAIVCHGPCGNLIYVGDVAGADFESFDLRANVMTKPGADSGIFFHCTHRNDGLLVPSCEVQINNSCSLQTDAADFRRTGSLHGIRNVYKSVVSDNQWFILRLLVEGPRVRVFVDNCLLVDYMKPEGSSTMRQGTFALRCQDAHGEVLFKDIRVRPLPKAVPASPVASPDNDNVARRITRLQQHNYPIADLHVHLKGGLTLQQALARSRQTGIPYGIAVNCGLDFPIKDDSGINKFADEMKTQPAFVAMQAEGREWVKLFSPEAIARFDYVFTDAMTFTDEQGRRIHLWKPEEVKIDDPEAFMDMYVRQIVAIIANEPIDIYVNATYLPECIAARYNQLWTEARMRKVIDAAVKNRVAVEINARYCIPSPEFIKLAKRQGVKFTFGTNNTDQNLGRLEYCLKMVDDCGLTPDDLYLPRAKTTK